MYTRLEEKERLTPAEYMKDMQMIARMRLRFFQSLSNSIPKTPPVTVKPIQPKPYDPAYEAKCREEFKVPDQLGLNAIGQAKGLYNFTFRF